MGSLAALSLARGAQADIDPQREKAFLLGVAVRVAADVRRAQARRAHEPIDEALPSSEPSAETQLALHRARAMLATLIDQLPDELRAVFVLHELENLTMTDIAQTLELAPGTVASRLRRARAEFTQRATRHTNAMKQEAR